MLTLPQTIGKDYSQSDDTGIILEDTSAEGNRHGFLVGGLDKGQKGQKGQARTGGSTTVSG
jgi:hypothetical protein